MDDLFKNINNKYQASQSNLFHESLIKAKNSMNMMTLQVNITKLPIFNSNMSSSYSLKTTHYKYTKTYFKSKSNKQLSYIPYNPSDFHKYNINYNKIYKITPMNLQMIYGEYTCKLLLQYINEVFKVFGKSITESINDVKRYLNIKIKSCIKSEFLSNNSNNLLPFSSKFCSVCYKYCCLLHPIFKKFETEIELNPIIEPMNIYYKNWKGKYLYNEIQGPNSIQWLSSYKCSTHNPESSMFSNNNPLIEKLNKLNIFNPCAISILLNIPCTLSLLSQIPKQIPKQKLPKKWYTLIKAFPQNNTSSNCTCLRCDSSCQCIKGYSKSIKKSFESRGYCERYCKCGYDCPYKFLGCDCAESCRSSKCICFINFRECDPYLCRGCRSFQELCTGIESCNNIRLQRGLSKRTFIGISLITNAGSGVFSADEIKPGELINEYSGELISNNEADRRGILYDINEHSFIFGIDSMHSIDATYAANKMRYINHKKHSEANCESQIWRIKGITKVLIIAKSYISPLEELYFDYKYPSSVPYSWFQSQLIN